MKETYSNKEVKAMIKDIVSLAFDPCPDADFYMKVFEKYDSDMQDYIINLLLAALMARKFAELTLDKGNEAE